ncbi:MAG TPA: VOC family protein [Woeseiaceae bacterium]|nr:VOC family protein [Woeseiaceae bacterium]
MHKSRLAGFIIDCETDDLRAGTKFWSQALGYPTKPPSEAEEGKYTLLDTGPNNLHIELQSVDHPSRVHLDIEADDIEAEVARLEQLGAKRLKKVRTWVVMEAPTGHRFCVVKPQRADFDEAANTWQP